MPSIHILSEETINQVAAGEVVETPASVVKELVENSLDAQASEIHVEIKRGGLQSILVYDNGVGMSPEEAALSLQRHATSKIQCFEDLYRLDSMGFRGEALPSIAAVSFFTMTTSDGNQGTKISVEGGKVQKIVSCHRKQGTTIEISSLFYNVPARREFQRSENFCAYEIQRLMNLFALSSPHVNFSFKIEEKEWIYRPQELQERVEDVLGQEFLKDSLTCQWEDELMKGKGILGAPSLSKKNRTGQYLFINRRPIHSFVISAAVQEGYGTRLSERSHPSFLLYLDFPSHSIDVNVHPQKKEVKFREEKKIKEKIINYVHASLTKPLHAISLLVEPTGDEERFGLDFPIEWMKKHPEESAPIEKKEYHTCQVVGLYRFFLLLNGQEVKEEGIVCVNLSACERELIYRRGVEGRIESQALLFPEVLTLSRDKIDFLKSEPSLLEALGFEIREISLQAVSIDALPSFLEIGSLSGFFDSLSEDLLHFSAFEEKKKVWLKKALRFKKARNYSIDEALMLVHAVEKEGIPSFCPLGKKIIKIVKNGELEN